MKVVKKVHLALIPQFGMAKTEAAPFFGPSCPSKREPFTK